MMYILLSWEAGEITIAYTRLKASVLTIETGQNKTKKSHNIFSDRRRITNKKRELSNRNIPKTEPPNSLS